MEACCYGQFKGFIQSENGVSPQIGNDKDKCVWCWWASQHLTNQFLETNMGDVVYEYNHHLGCKLYIIKVN